MWLTSKIKQILMVAKPGVVTLKYPFEPRPAPENFRGAPHWDHTKCVGCAGCANHCPARTILVRDLCQEVRVLLYDGARCTYCGRCADVCPEKAITMTGRFEQATDDRNDITENLELFMLTCQRCGRCYDLETKNALDRLGLTGYRYDSLEARTVIRRATDTFRPRELETTERYRRPDTTGD